MPILWDDFNSFASRIQKIQVLDMQLEIVAASVVIVVEAEIIIIIIF